MSFFFIHHFIFFDEFLTDFLKINLQQKSNIIVTFLLRCPLNTHSSKISLIDFLFKAINPITTNREIFFRIHGAASRQSRDLRK